MPDGVQGRAEQLYAALAAEGSRLLLDDRAERAGVNFKDADLSASLARRRGPRGRPQAWLKVVETRGVVKHEWLPGTRLCWLSPDRAGRRSSLLSTRTGLSDRRFDPLEESSGQALGLPRIVEHGAF